MASEAVETEVAWNLGKNTPAVRALLGAIERSEIRVSPTLTKGAPQLAELMAKYERMDVCDGSLMLLSERFPQAKILTVDFREFPAYRRFGRQPGGEHGGNPLFENAEMAADVVELGNRKKLLIVLALLEGDVSRDRIDQGLLAIWSAVVGQGKIEVERMRLGRVGEAAERSLGLAELVVGKKCGSAADVTGGLCGLRFKGSQFRSGLFARFEVLTDAEAVKPTGDSPRNDAVAIFKPGNVK